MEKISHILPPSNRVTTVDTSISQSLRPGAPSMGRRGSDNPKPTIKASERPEPEADRVTLSKTALERLKGLNSPESEEEESNSNHYKKNPDSSKVKIVEELNRKFFNNLKKEYTGKEDPHSQQVFDEL